MNEHLNKVKEERRDARGIQWLEILVKDLQFAVRQRPDRRSMQDTIGDLLRQLFQQRGVQIAAATRDLEDCGKQFGACDAFSYEPARPSLQ